MRACKTCGKKLEKVWILFGICEDCGKAECEKGNHLWEPAAIGPGVAIFDCIFCDATSDGSLDTLRQLAGKTP